MMDDKGQQFLAAEQAKSLPDSRAYWKVSYEWVDAIRAWLEGWSLSQIAAEYELFEGNVQRAVLKLASLAEEWIVLLTLSKDVEQLRVWMSESGSARERILRDIVVAESLYLRL